MSPCVKLSSEEVEAHLFAWDRFRRALIGFMGHDDVILTPAAEQPATPHGAPSGGIPYTLPYSLTGYSCVVVRGGTMLDGLRIGVQVVARPRRDLLICSQRCMVSCSFQNSFSLSISWAYNQPIRIFEC